MKTKTKRPRGPSDTEVLTAVQMMLQLRSEKMNAALEHKDCPHKKGTTAHAWHAGYISAMQDALRMIKKRPGEYPVTMRVTGSR